MPRRTDDQLNFVDQLENLHAAGPSPRDLLASEPKTSPANRHSKLARLKRVQDTAPTGNILIDPECRYFSDKDVAKRYGVSRPTIWRWVKNNAVFPNPIQLSPGTTRWKLSDLQAYERSVNAAHSGAKVPEGEV